MPKTRHGCIFIYEIQGTLPAHLYQILQINGALPWMAMKCTEQDMQRKTKHMRQHTNGVKEVSMETATIPECDKPKG